MPTRRKVLKLIGGGTVLAATAATVGCDGSAGVAASAREPWRRAGGYDDFRKRALSYALLAPNPHNRQPWLVQLDGADALTLHVDLARRLPATDPLDRQITIGCGAFLELLSIAALQDGYTTDIAAFPEGEDMRTLDRRPVATVRFVGGAASPDPLFQQILARRSNKAVYEARDVAADSLAALAAAGRSYGVDSATEGNTALTATLRDLTWRAHMQEVTTPAANQESVDLMRIGAREVAANPDGIVLEGPMIEFARRFGFLSREALADPTSSAFKQGLELYRKMAMSARAFGWLVNGNRSRADQLAAGRAYVRMNLKATELGLGVHPWSQALQEYPQMAALYREAHELVGQGGTLQMLYRIGHAKEIGPTPRRGLEAHLA
jgi:hypothetical protein